MRYFLLTFVLLSLCSCMPSPDNKITSVEFGSNPNVNLRYIKVCMETPPTSSYLSRIIIETKDGVTLDRSDVLIGDRGGKETCFNKYIIANLMTEGETKESVNRSVVYGNISEIKVFMSNSIGWNYSEKKEFTRFQKQY
ncbi:MAG: hypothetical protein OCC45_08860 [Desulfotalea sp.]